MRRYREPQPYGGKGLEREDFQQIAVREPVAPLRDRLTAAERRFINFADRVLHFGYILAFRRYCFWLIGTLLAETKEKIRNGRKAVECAQVRRRYRQVEAFAIARARLPKKKYLPRFRWATFGNGK